MLSKKAFIYTQVKVASGAGVFVAANACKRICFKRSVTVLKAELGWCV